MGFERHEYSPIVGYLFCDSYDDGLAYEYYLYVSNSGVGFVKRVAKSKSTTTFSKFFKGDNIKNNLWNFTTHQVRLTGDGYYHYWHEHPQKDS